jgi:hypothetical protein
VGNKNFAGSNKSPKRKLKTKPWKGLRPLDPAGKILIISPLQPSLTGRLLHVHPFVSEQNAQNWSTTDAAKRTDSVFHTSLPLIKRNSLSLAMVKIAKTPTCGMPDMKKVFSARKHEVAWERARIFLLILVLKMTIFTSSNSGLLNDATLMSYRFEKTLSYFAGVCRAL